MSFSLSGVVTKVECGLSNRIISKKYLLKRKKTQPVIIQIVVMTSLTQKSAELLQAAQHFREKFIKIRSKVFGFDG